MIDQTMKTSRLQQGSLMNCHARGVDSLVLKGAPQMVRIFLARPDHELWSKEGEPLALGLHAHHCDVTLIPLFGPVENARVDLFPPRHPRHVRRLTPYHYHSPIRGEAGSFLSMGNRRSFTLRYVPLELPVSLKASELHTVSVPKGQLAAWMVVEGKEDRNYLPITYSDADLTRFDFNGMYQPISAERLEEDIILLANHGVNLG